MSQNNFDDSKPLGHFSAFQTYWTHNWITNEHFYSLIPAPYREFYWRFVKNWFYWYDGYVPYFHTTQSGMFSSRLAYTVFHNLAQQVIGNKIIFNDDGVTDSKTINYNGKKKLSSLEFVEEWSKVNNLDNKAVQLKEWAFAGGDAVIKLDGMGGELVPTILRKDNYWISTGFNREIDEFTGLIYNYSRMAKQDKDQSTEYYYILEDRKYNEQGVPQIRISVKKGIATLLTNKTIDVTPESIPFERLPRDIRHKFKRDFPNVKLGVWEDLPLKDLGVYLDKASERISFLPAMPGGESLSSNCIDIYQLYDYYESSIANNMWIAKDKVLIPQHLQPPKMNESMYFCSNPYSSFNDQILIKLPYSNPDDASPMVFQPEIRDWEKMRNNLLQTFAFKLGVDDRAVSSAIVPNAEKPTAREISSDENKTILFAEGQQTLTKSALDPMLECLLDFYGFNDEVITVKFNKSGLSNINNVTTVVTILKQNGLIDDKTALEMVFKDKSNKQIQNMLDAIQEQKDRDFERQQQVQQSQENDVEEKMEQNEGQSEFQLKKPKE